MSNRHTLILSLFLIREIEEELENVNGGIRVKTTDPRKKTFEVRVE